MTEKDLDFSHMRDHMRRILAGQSSLFSFGTDNAVVQLVSRGAPRLLLSQVCPLLQHMRGLYSWTLIAVYYVLLGLFSAGLDRCTTVMVN